MLPKLKMVPARQLAVAVPIALCLATSILTVLALTAGQQRGFLEDYAILRLNTSDIARGTGAPGKLGAAPGNATGNAADELGVSDWYSIHVTNSCEGSFAAPGQLRVTRCTASSPSYRFNLAQLGVPRSIQDKLDNINDVLSTLFVLFLLGATGSALAAAAAAAAPAHAAPRRSPLILLNLALSSLAAFCLFLAAIVVTAAAAIGERALNGAGAPLGIRADMGMRLVVLAWVATGLVALAAAYWVLELLLVYWDRRRARKDMLQAKLPY